MNYVVFVDPCVVFVPMCSGRGILIYYTQNQCHFLEYVRTVKLIVILSRSILIYKDGIASLSTRVLRLYKFSPWKFQRKYLHVNIWIDRPRQEEWC